MTKRDLRPLYSPRSVAVVGASAAGGRATGAIRNLQELGFTGKIFAINPKYDNVLGAPCYPSLKAVPEPIDLVCIGIPSEHIQAVLDEAAECKIPAAVIFASGYGEAGETGRARQKELQDFAARSGMAISGPNCLGVLNFQDRACGYSSTSPSSVETGGVAVVSQSGSVVVAMVRSLRGIGFSHIVSSGNEAVITSADHLEYLVEDPRVTVLAAFLEGIKDPVKFLKVADRAFELGKPLIVLKSGRSAGGSAASAAHTGTLAGSYQVQSAVFRQHGVIQAQDFDEWVELIEMFRGARPPSGPGIGIIGISGGENGVVMDVAEDVGLDVRPLSETGKTDLAKILPWFARPENPIDPTGGAANPDIFLGAVGVLAAEPQLDVIVISQDSPAAYDLTVAKYAVEAAKRTGKCLVYVNNFSGPWNPEILKMLRDAGVPYLQGLREGLLAIRAFIDYHARRKEPPKTPRAPPATQRQRDAQARAIIAAGGALVTEDEAKKLLALYDLPVPREVAATSKAEAVAAADTLGYPVVAKLISPDLPHKAAVGGVRLGLKSAAEVAAAYDEMTAGIARSHPQAKITGVLVQPMVTGGIEIILGVKRDPQFGPTVLFGLGGIFVEALRQVSMRLAPFDEREARSMIAEIPAFGRIFEKLYPGKNPETLVLPLLLKLSELAVEIGGDIEDIDINPVILDPASDRATIVDALIVPAS